MKELRNIFIILFTIIVFASYNKIDTILNDLHDIKPDTNTILGALILGALVWWIWSSRRKKVVYIEVEKGKGGKK